MKIAELRGRGESGRQLECERGPFAGRAFDADSAVMGLDDAATETQTEPGSAPATGFGGSLGAVKRVEDEAELVGGDADAPSDPAHNQRDE